MMDDLAYPEVRAARVRAAVEKHTDATGAVPAEKVQTLMDDLTAVVEDAYVQGLEDAQ